MDDLLMRINELLNSLGVTANYTGFFQMRCSAPEKRDIEKMRVVL